MSEKREDKCVTCRWHDDAGRRCFKDGKEFANAWLRCIEDKHRFWMSREEHGHWLTQKAAPRQFRCYWEES